MRDDFTEKYQDVLQNLEFAIVRAYERDPSLLDLDVIDLLDAAIRRYGAVAQGRVPSAHRLANKVVPAYALLERMCEFRLGRTSMGGEADTPEVYVPDPLSIDELLACLKRLRKSANFWNAEAGRQGYLEYVSQFVGIG